MHPSILQRPTKLTFPIGRIRTSIPRINRIHLSLSRTRPNGMNSSSRFNRYLLNQQQEPYQLTKQQYVDHAHARQHTLQLDDEQP
uniref:Uncharacterized protein n=1 Tax=Picea glauca TaxID=3330 RepID=A0A101M510_PICGL|nr:hypothetical protein ABT39_MTgene843 [Picea glauca]QHR88313.1 hypothetical protein Q903MT_gene2326 [Picea sitchensis]